MVVSEPLGFASVVEYSSVSAETGAALPVFAARARADEIDVACCPEGAPAAGPAEFDVDPEFGGRGRAG
jgi:hypothetical protein